MPEITVDRNSGRHTEVTVYRDGEVLKEPRCTEIVNGWQRSLCTGMVEDRQSHNVQGWWRTDSHNAQGWCRTDRATMYRDGGGLTEPQCTGMVED